MYSNRKICINVLKYLPRILLCLEINVRGISRHNVLAIYVYKIEVSGSLGSIALNC